FCGQDPANVLFRQIIGAFAQFEKARITERPSGGRKQKASRGGYAGGAAAMGYKATRGAKALEFDTEMSRRSSGCSPSVRSGRVYPSGR
ncbi:MAG: recombinase family protein, partial [Methanomicrobiales archaeon]|nr:recombinase family protein [Methanomicrobiales archaeon]